MDELHGQIKRLSIGIQELIECPVCFCTMDSTLQLCVNGHGVCKTCATKVKKCPTCQQELVVRQSTLLAQILEFIPKQCRYSDKGCDTFVFDIDHVVYCGFRTSKCFKTHCEWEGCAKDLLDHVKNCTNGSPLCEFANPNEKKARSYTFYKYESKQFFSPILFNNQLIWKYFHRNALTKCISHKFYHVPTEKPSSNYYFSISFKKDNVVYKHTSKATVDIQTEVGRYPKPVESGLIIPDSDVDKFLEEGSCHTYLFTIKLKVEDIE